MKLKPRFSTGDCLICFHIFFSYLCLEATFLSLINNVSLFGILHIQPCLSCNQLSIKNEFDSCEAISDGSLICQILFPPCYI